jgi:hypothetical protein
VIVFKYCCFFQKEGKNYGASYTIAENACAQNAEKGIEQTVV